MGMVYNQSAFLYRPGKSVGDYLDQAGGPTRDADGERMYLLHADGSLVSAQNSGSIFNSFSSRAMMPGDAIIVPEQLDKNLLTGELVQWSQIFYQFALGAAGLKVLGL
jgi:protein involved in polysaccharide export with SLBB domain